MLPLCPRRYVWRGHGLGYIIDQQMQVGHLTIGVPFTVIEFRSVTVGTAARPRVRLYGRVLGQSVRPIGWVDLTSLQCEEYKDDWSKPKPMIIDRTAQSNLVPRLACLTLVFVGVLVAWLSARKPRQYLLVSIAAIFFVRFAAMLLQLVPRPVPIWEAICTGGGMAVLPFWLGAIANDALDFSAVDGAALLVHVVGSLLTSGSEMQRWRFKRCKRNAGRLFVEGLFSQAKHINYTGEVLTFVGWCALTRRRDSLLVPLFFAIALHQVYAPDLDRYIRRRYKGDARFGEWRALPGFVPTNLSACLVGALTSAVVVSLCIGEVIVSPAAADDAAQTERIHLYH